MAYPNFKHLPLYQKALDLSEMAQAIASYISFNKDMKKLCSSNSFRDNLAHALLTDSVLIPEKIQAATHTHCQRERIQAASFIQIIIKNINSYCLGLEKDGIKEVEYLNLLRKEVKSFKKSFKVWRRSQI
ncbi:hypothetical protein [Maribacter sp. 2307ULW6-5]|uniref:hypothetical protein n=1 Tax=Maribacter sp. 2307ULW6-5 TaxID=3386275 RepID=UPI0039BD7B50